MLCIFCWHCIGTGKGARNLWWKDEQICSLVHGPSRQVCLLRQLHSVWKTCAAQRRWSTSRSLLVSGAGWHAKEGVAPMPLLPKSRVLLELLSLGGWLLCWTGREHLQLAGALPTRRKGRDKGAKLIFATSFVDPFVPLKRNVRSIYRIWWELFTHNFNQDFRVSN